MMVPDTPMPNGADPSCVLFLAATGDQGYQRRLNLGGALMKQVREWSGVYHAMGG